MDFDLTHTLCLLYSPTLAGPLDILLFFVFPNFLVSASGFLRFFGFFAFIVFYRFSLGFSAFIFYFYFLLKILNSFTFEQILNSFIFEQFYF
jgi:hypothetical protein